ncbi:SGNH/GDSL hydrolase family protein [Telmatospirillum sp. J64-1]|uniref:SGNH/GDSL hydrolase family protein n=1 Tax=Telmatospirillum sp. J64-1 TaxID=2502183 RepID=UPI00115DBBB2|nr:SGNH/GDSL hydrolase family protein [Telmatospirillum sp. J64-1]
MKTILAFGDSLTWGTDPVAGGRHRFEDRWPSVLEAELGGGYRVIPEGLSGRTTAFDDLTVAFERNGAKALPMLLASHAPLDLIIIMLGSNDLKAYISPTVHGAAAGMGRLVEIVRSFPYAWGMTAPRIMIVSPPHFCYRDGGEGPPAGRLVPESHKLAAAYRALAETRGCTFFDAATVAAACPIDGVHLDAANTRAIGKALAAPVRALLGETA